jgi:hypothetical protein
VLGGLSLGKYPSWDEEAPFAHFLALKHEEGLPHVLESEADPDTELARWQALSRDTVSLRSATATYRSSSGHAILGFDTDVVCYGINGHRTPDELRAIWETARRAMARFPRHRDRLVARFAPFLTYYEGCALRGSADIYLVW